MRAELAEMAANNGGPFTRSQALRAGYTPMAIRVRLRKGEWVVLRTGVYVDGELLRSLGVRARHGAEAAAAILALRAENAAVRHHSAAFLHGLDLLSLPESITLTHSPSSGGHGDQAGGGHVHRAGLPRQHVGQRYGVPITSAARTVVDLARALPFREGVMVADSAARLCEVSQDTLERVLHDCSTWPWIHSAAHVLAFVDPRAESALESLSRVLFAEAGIPRPRTQTLLGDEYGPIGRVDFYWPQFRVVVEVDGMVKYKDQPLALVAEKRRQERLENAGFVVVRLTWDDVARFPEQTIRRIREAFARAVAASA